VAATAALATLATGLHRGDVAGVLLGASVGVRAWELVSLDAQGVERFGLDALELARGNALVDDRAAGDGDRHGLAVELDDLDELHAAISPLRHGVVGAFSDLGRMSTHNCDALPCEKALPGCITRPW
jgi:hypothetical protein